MSCLHSIQVGSQVWRSRQLLFPSPRWFLKPLQKVSALFLWYFVSQGSQRDRTWLVTLYYHFYNYYLCNSVAFIIHLPYNYYEYCDYYSSIIFLTEYNVDCILHAKSEYHFQPHYHLLRLSPKYFLMPLYYYFIHSLLHSLIHPNSHLLIHSFTHSISHSYIHLLTCSFIRYSLIAMLYFFLDLTVSIDRLNLTFNEFDAMTPRWSLSSI